MTARSTTKRDRHRRIIAARRPPCGLCGHPIDYSLPYLDPMEFVIDHVIPLSRGGDDTLGNLRATHRSCNSTKRARLDDEPIGARRATIRTSREW